MVVASIIGVDRFTGGYMAAKAALERAMRAGPIPVSVVRAARFHEFVARLVGWGRRGDPARVEEAGDPGDPDRDLYETDAMLPGPGAILAGPTFAEWLGYPPAPKAAVAATGVAGASGSGGAPGAGGP
jgi:hypothetical protein